MVSLSRSSRGYVGFHLLLFSWLLIKNNNDFFLNQRLKLSRFLATLKTTIANFTSFRYITTFYEIMSLFSL